MLKSPISLSIAASLIAPGAIATATTSPSAEETSASRRTSAWLPYWDTSRGLSSFQANADLFDQLLPFWYEMQSSRSVTALTDDRQRVLDAARAAGVRILPTVTNSFDAERVSQMLGSSSSIDTHVATLVELTNGVDGIDIDYEGLYSSDRDRFSDFVERLSAALRSKGKLLSMTLHPKTSEPGSWSGPQAQDWSRIGAAADRVRVMAYDYHWASSGPGPIAPLSWVDRVVAFAVSKMPASKVDLGMPLYGYDWLGSSGSGLTWDAIDARRVASGATMNRSSDGGEPWFRYSTQQGDRTVWYSDGYSTAQKLDVVTRYGIKGHTFWRLGGEDPDVWSRVRAWSGSSTTPPPDEVPPTRVKRPKARSKTVAVALSWSPSSDESPVRYRVLRATSKTGRFRRIATVSRTAFHDRRVRSNKRYFYAVRAIDTAGNTARRSAKVAAAPR